MSTSATIESAIDRAWTLASSAYSDANAFTDKAFTATAGAFTPGAIPDLAEPDGVGILIPDLNIPDDDLRDILKDEENAATRILKEELDYRLEEFLSTYYPDYTPNLQNIADWLDKAITEGGTGVPVHIERAIWDRDRSRYDQQVLRGEQEVMNVWASRGFPLPPGAATRQMAQVRQDAFDKLQDRSREIAIEAAKLEIENVRFAIQQGASLQMQVMNTAIEYMNSVLAIASNAQTHARALVDAIVRMHDITAQYARLKFESERLQLDFSVQQADDALETARTEASVYDSRVKNQVEAAMAAARTLGDAAAAALSSQTTIATLAHETSASE